MSELEIGWARGSRSRSRGRSVQYTQRSVGLCQTDWLLTPLMCLTGWVEYVLPTTLVHSYIESCKQFRAPMLLPNLLGDCLLSTQSRFMFDVSLFRPLSASMG